MNACPPWSWVTPPRPVARGGGVVDLALLTQLYGLTIPVLLASRALQIRDVYMLGSVGQLSGITLGMNFAGVAARVFTTLQEVDDTLVLAAALAALACNTILFAQYLYYRTRGSAKVAASAAAADKKKK